MESDYVGLDHNNKAQSKWALFACLTGFLDEQTQQAGPLGKDTLHSCFHTCTAELPCSWVVAELLGEILVLQRGTGEEANRGGLGCGDVLHLAVIQHLGT